MRPVAIALLLAACGASPPRTAISDDDAAVRSVLRAAYGESVELVAVRVVAATTFAVYAHDDASLASIAAEHVCRETRVAPLAAAPGCAHLAIARLAADRASVERAYELGLWCDGASSEIEIGDFDDDDRDEMSLRVEDRVFVVIDLATFDVQFVSAESHFAIPEGMGVYDPAVDCWRGPPPA